MSGLDFGEQVIELLAFDRNLSVHHSHFLTLRLHSISHRHKIWLLWGTRFWFSQQICQSCLSHPPHRPLGRWSEPVRVLKPYRPETPCCPKCFCILPTPMFLFSLPFPLKKTETGKWGYILTSSSKTSGVWDLTTKLEGPIVNKYSYLIGFTLVK